MCCYKPAKHSGGYIGVCFEKFVAPRLARKPIGTVVIMAFLGWGATNSQVEDSQRSFMPDDSYLRASMDR